MSVKGTGKDVIGDDTPAVRGRHARSAMDPVKDSNTRGGVARKDKPVVSAVTARRVARDATVIDKAPPEVTAAVKASENAKNAIDHMIKVVTETGSQIVTGEAKIPSHSGPVTDEALAAFVGAVKEVAGDKVITVAAARRAGLVAAAASAWEDALGPQLDTAHVRELLGGVSKQRINELLRRHRLIGVQTSNARWQFPAFQFVDGRLPAPKLAEVFWQLSTRAIDPWSAASWCVSPNSALDGRTPAEVAASDAELVATVGERDADRLSR